MTIPDARAGHPADPSQPSGPSRPADQSSQVHRSHPVDSPLTQLSLAELRQRRSAKWRVHPEDILPLWLAEMDTPLAEPIRAALAAAVARSDTGYVHAGQLAEAYAEFSGEWYGWSPDPSRARLVGDVMHGIVEVLRVVTAPGDRIVINPPVYAPFFAYIPYAERQVVQAPLAGHGTGAYRLDLAALERVFAEGAAAYLLCNPHNPTGTAFTREELLAVAELAHRYGVRLVVDEIHAPLTFPGVRHVPMLSLAGGSGPGAAAAARAFVLVSASKAWNLPGLKAALLLAGPDAAAELAGIPPLVEYAADLFGVIATEAALRECRGWLSDVLAGLDANRALLARLLADRLPQVRYRPPDATYLAWLDCRELGLGDDPAEAFRDRGRVALYPGTAFGDLGRGFVRLNLATTPVLLDEAVRRMATAAR